MGVLFSLGLGGGAGTVAAFDEKKAESQNHSLFPSRHFAPPFRFPAPFLFFPFHHNP